MKKINIVINNRVAQTLHQCKVVCGNTDYKVVFDFDAEWSAFDTKTARFIWNGHHTDVNFKGNTCKLPKIFNAKEVKVGVYAGDLRTTTAAKIVCEKSIFSGGEPQHPSNEQSFISEAKKAAEKAEAAARVATIAAEKAELKGGGSSFVKIVLSEEEMDGIISRATDDYIDSFYMYLGTTGKYTKGSVYRIRRS